MATARPASPTPSSARSRTPPEQRASSESSESDSQENVLNQLLPHASSSKKRAPTPASTSRGGTKFVVEVDATRSSPTQGKGKGKGKGRVVEMQDNDDGDAIGRPTSAASGESTIGHAALEKSIREDEEAEARERRRLEALALAEEDDDDGDEEEDDSEDGEDEPEISDAILAELQDETICRQWKQCHIEQAELDIKVDQIIHLNGGKDWIGEVKDMRSLNSQMQLLRDDDGVALVTAKNRPRYAVNNIYIQNAWMYSASHLKGLKNDSRIHPKLKFMGSREYVTTDMLDWHRQIDVAGLCKPVFDFEDRYPSPTATVSHPLSSRPQGKRDDENPPVYFFGDSGELGTDAEYNLHAEAKYVRVHFDFSVAVGSGKDKGKAGAARPRSVKPITFNLHSISKTPYTPKLVQHYSRSSRTWYHVSDLAKKKSFGPITEYGASDDDDDGTDYEREPTSTNSTKRRATAATGALQSPKKKQKKKASSGVEEGGPVEALEKLSRKPIVRGGAYGLIGNSYLVTRAQEILEYDPNLQQEDNVEEGENLVAAAKEWLGIVERRTKAGLERGMAPDGKHWLCPVSHDHI